MVDIEWQYSDVGLFVACLLRYFGEIVSGPAIEMFAIGQLHTSKKLVTFSLQLRW